MLKWFMCRDCGDFRKHHFLMIVRGFDLWECTECGQPLTLEV